MKAQPCRKRSRFLAGEVVQFDTLSYIERGNAGVTDKIAWRRYSQQAEGEVVKYRLTGPPVVTFADAGKELIGGEGQTAYRVDLVYK